MLYFCQDNVTTRNFTGRVGRFAYFGFQDQHLQFWQASLVVLCAELLIVPALLALLLSEPHGKES